MREFNRRVANAQSGRATPEELREATQRYKELQDELRQMDLSPETRNGEERLDRYERELRLRAMREDFQANAETPLPQPRNSAMLALIMTVASFLLCAFCAGGTYTGLLLLNQTPNPQTAADAFWSALEGASSATDYQSIHDTYLAPSLRVAQSGDQFATLAMQADKQFGKVTSASLSKSDTATSNQATLTYTVTRTDANGAKKTYAVTLALTLRQNSWAISDYSNLFTPATSSTAPTTPNLRAFVFGRAA
ncbi:MAG TPA: hypothetical protein VF818_08070 [Ktedonobacterales bacterium]